MRVAVIHPLKHHIYYSMAGIKKSGAEVIGLFGYYYKNDFVDRLVKRTKWKKQLEGYHYDKIEDEVRTNRIIKILFLLSKAYPKVFQQIFERVFENWCIKNLRGIDCIHVLQDYENRVIRYAQKKGIRIVYEQIIAFDIEQYITSPTEIETDVKLKMQKENLYNAERIIVGSEFVKQSIQNRIDDEKIIKKIDVVPYGADVDRFTYKKKKYEKDDMLKLLIVASVTKRKGFEYLIDAMDKLKNKKVKLTVIGKKNQNEQKLSNKLNLMNNVEYLGVVPHEQINQCYANADVFILPSLAEGSSLSIYEALASGLPCIVTENAGSVVENGKEGLIVTPKSVDSIVAAIQQLLDSPELVEKMSINAKKTIKEYTLEHYESKIEDVYRKMRSAEKQK